MSKPGFVKYIVAVLLLVGSVFAQNPSQPQPQTVTTMAVNLLNPPVAPAGLSISQVGAPGSSALVYYYWVVTRTAIGNSSPAGPVIGFNANSTLSGSNFFKISWQAASSATGYDVLRTTTPAPPNGACACAVTTNTASLSVNDQSNSLSAYTVITLDPNTLQLQLANEAQGGGGSHYILRQNGAFVSDLSAASGGGTPGGANTQVQFNNSGAFAGDSGYTYNSTTKQATVGYSATSAGPFVDPMAFGAVGNGSADDTIPFQAAVTVQESSGGEVFLGSGRSYSLGRILLSGFDTIRGTSGIAGEKASRIFARSDGVFVSATPATYINSVTITDVLFRSSGVNAIDIPFVTELDLERIHFFDGTGCNVALVDGERWTIHGLTGTWTSANGQATLCTGDSTQSLFSGSITPQNTWGPQRGDIAQIYSLGSSGTETFHSNWLWRAGNGIAGGIIHETNVRDLSCFYSCHVGVLQTNEMTDSHFDIIDLDHVAVSGSPQPVGILITLNMGFSTISRYNPGYNFNNQIIEMQVGQLLWSTISNSRFSSTVDNSTTFGLVLVSGSNTGTLLDDFGGLFLSNPGPVAAPAIIGGGQMTPNNAGVSTAAHTSFIPGLQTDTMTLGRVGFATGDLDVKGSTSGIVSVKAQAAAGTYNFNLPITAGSAGTCLTSQGGGASAMTWTACGGASGVSSFTGDGTLITNSASTGAVTVTLGKAIPTGVIVGTTDSQTLTNKTLTSPILGGTPDASGAAQFKLPVAAGFATLVNGEIGYDTTNSNWHVWKNGADALLGVLSGAITTGHCLQASVSSSVTSIVDSGSSNCGGGGSVTWDAIGNPAGNLTLSMGSNTSTFNTTTALSQMFAWKNTTAAVVGTSQGSPILADCGRAFHGSADVEDCMTFRELPGNGNDAKIAGIIDHTGTSTGLFQLQTPGSFSAGTPPTSALAAGDMSAARSATVGLFDLGSDGTIALCRGCVSGVVTIQGTIPFQASSFQVAGGTTAAAGFAALGTTVVGSLPAAGVGNVGQIIKVSDSTTVSAEGQTCAGGSSNTALAFSNGTVWKCF
jgi:hypothetical protein